MADLRPIVHRKQQRAFTEKFAEKVAAGMDIEIAKIEAVQESYPHFNGKTKPRKSRAAAKRKADDLLEKKPWIQKGLELLFTAAGLPPEEAASVQVSLVNHEDPEVAQRGLNAYWNLTIPKQTQKLEVRSLSVMEILNRPEPLPIDTTSTGWEENEAEGSPKAP